MVVLRGDAAKKNLKRRTEKHREFELVGSSEWHVKRWLETYHKMGSKN